MVLLVPSVTRGDGDHRAVAAIAEDAAESVVAAPALAAVHQGVSPVYWSKIGLPTLMSPQLPT